MLASFMDKHEESVEKGKQEERRQKKKKGEENR